MKKITLLLFTFILAANLNAQNEIKTEAEGESVFKNSLRINTLGIFSGFYEFQYERVLSANSSIKVGFGTGTLRDKSGKDANKDFMEAFGSNTFNNGNEHIVDGFTINADYRYFFGNKPAPQGIYVSPGIQYLKLNETYRFIDDEGPRTLVDNDYSIFNIRALFGYQFIIANRVVINPYAGVGFALGSVDSKNRVDAFGSGFTLNLGLDMGIGF